MPRRNRALSLFLIPIAIFMWCIGWGLYFIGFEKESTRSKPKQTALKDMIIFVPPQEQQYAT